MKHSLKRQPQQQKLTPRPLRRRWVKPARVLCKVSIFTGLLLVLLLGLSRLFTPLQPGEKWSIHPEQDFPIKAEPLDSIDAVMLGDSLGYGDFVPALLWHEYGYTTYVCSQSAQPLEEAWAQLQATLVNQSPQLVMLETDQFYRSTTLASDLSRALLFEAGQHLPVFRFHDQWKQLLGLKQTPSLKALQQTQLKGYRFSKLTQGYNGTDYMNDSGILKVQPVTTYYLSKIVKLCQERGISLLFISMPSPKNYSMKRHNGIAQLAQQYNIPYLDLNLDPQQCGIDWSKDTRDKGDHLNYLGAQKATLAIGSYLAEHYQLPDRRGSDFASSWDDAWSAYQQLCQDAANPDTGGDSSKIGVSEPLYLPDSPDLLLPTTATNN
ncbi:hypothetical protein HCH52_01845 [Oscillospiraceae bacterium HV4-5-C5C]|nr:hypothetical protein [Oscillospiraceae bacterium HV4-5-C5C]